jgi:hypothetical protein
MFVTEDKKGREEKNFLTENKNPQEEKNSQPLLNARTPNLADVNLAINLHLLEEEIESEDEEPNSTVSHPRLESRERKELRYDMEWRHN